MGPSALLVMSDGANMKVLISGASGLIGTELRKQLAQAGHEAVSLVRRKATGPNEVEWDPARGYLAPNALDAVDAVVNLAGATTGKLPWTKKYKQELVSSRIDSTRTLVEAINKSLVKPKVFISGSASGYYGDAGNVALDEDAPKGSGFLSDLSAKWEQTALEADIRTVLIRTTMVMSPKLGALGRLLPLIKLGIGGALGNGRQWWAWISLRDEVRAILHLIANEDCEGVFNLTAPEFATCDDVVQALARVAKRPAILKVPKFALRLAFGEGADELLLGSQKMTATKLLATGFRFEHPNLESAARYSLNR